MLFGHGPNDLKMSLSESLNLKSPLKSSRGSLKSQRVVRENSGTKLSIRIKPRVIQSRPKCSGGLRADACLPNNVRPDWPAVQCCVGTSPSVRADEPDVLHDGLTGRAQGSPSPNCLARSVFCVRCYFLFTHHISNLNPIHAHISYHPTSVSCPRRLDGIIGTMRVAYCSR